MSEEKLNRMFSEQAAVRYHQIPEWPEGMKVSDLYAKGKPEFDEFREKFKECFPKMSCLGKSTK